MELLAAGDGHADDEVAGDAAREDQRVQDAKQHLRRDSPASFGFISKNREIPSDRNQNRIFDSAVAL